MNRKLNIQPKFVQCILEEKWIQYISKDMSKMMLENECLCKRYLEDVYNLFLKFVAKEGCMHAFLEEKVHARTLSGLEMKGAVKVNLNY